MRQTAFSTLVDVDRSQNASIWFDFGHVLELPKLLYLVSQAYSLGERWLAAHPPTQTDRADWHRANQISQFSVDVAIHKYLSPLLHNHVYERLADPEDSKLDDTRLDYLDDVVDENHTKAPTVLDDAHMHSLRGFVSRIVERMRYPGHTRGELNVRIFIRNVVDPDWKMDEDDDDVTNRKQLLLFLSALQKIFRREVSIKFTLINAREISEDDLTEAVDKYQDLLSSHEWTDGDFTMDFSTKADEPVGIKGF